MTKKEILVEKLHLNGAKFLAWHTRYGSPIYVYLIPESFEPKRDGIYINRGFEQELTDADGNVINTLEEFYYYIGANEDDLITKYPSNYL